MNDSEGVPPPGERGPQVDRGRKGTESGKGDYSGGVSGRDGWCPLRTKEVEGGRTTKCAVRRVGGSQWRERHSRDDLVRQGE